MKEMVHFLRGGPGGRPGGCPGASAPQNVVFLMVLEPRDSKMLHFLNFWSLEILKCCISVLLDDLEMLHFLWFWSLLELIKYCISIRFGASRFGNVAFLLVLECDAMEVFEKY